jgi:hypothetical protein
MLVHVLAEASAVHLALRPSCAMFQAQVRGLQCRRANHLRPVVWAQSFLLIF